MSAEFRLNNRETMRAIWGHAPESSFPDASQFNTFAQGRETLPGEMQL